MVFVGMFDIHENFKQWRQVLWVFEIRWSFYTSSEV